jgi:hypothetical protein
LFKSDGLGSNNAKALIGSENDATIVPVKRYIMDDFDEVIIDALQFFGVFLLLHKI